jgi:hypothetical protein
MSVDVALTLPVVALLVATVSYFRTRSLSVLSAMHAAQTDAWKQAMSDASSRCASGGGDGPLASVGLGVVGDQAKTLATSALPSLSFAFDSGGAQARVNISMARPPWPFKWLMSGSPARADYMPCNETVGGNDSKLPPAFDALWKQHSGPSQ